MLFNKVEFPDPIEIYNGETTVLYVFIDNYCSGNSGTKVPLIIKKPKRMQIMGAIISETKTFQSFLMILSLLTNVALKCSKNISE